ncbi:FAD-dependent oxidoreductase [Ferrimonas senticii]|uniref:FAD-dependent oxidoreductase n=1 Tax=Ferrimonas senticii TaxID=394566 RepID=UPI0004804C51|nr:FAD-dependent oxidoreductase [Ferrimonas senticii]
MFQHALAAAKPIRVGIIGGGVAGSTIAMHLSARDDVEVTLFEQGQSLVNGPPICHLHAGGNLYREIDDQQCLTLLQESIDTLKLFPHCANVRPTVIVVPQRDAGDVAALLPRLQLLQQHYQQLVAADPSNQVLGEPCDYFRCYSEAQLQQLALKPLPAAPTQHDDWLIPLAKELDFDSVKWPLILVQEYGLSLFRLAASAELTLAARTNCQVKLNHKVTAVKRCGGGFRLTFGGSSQDSVYVDYLINACGHLSGSVDDELQVPAQRMVEFKAAYLASWAGQGHWPEVIFHGERGTPNGMAQLTPYADGLFQLHGMTESITLFSDGLARAHGGSAQPKLPLPLRRKLKDGWPQQLVEQRSRAAIDHLAVFLPNFANANPAGKPLYGAQQIPGQDVSLRAADVEFPAPHYARAEIVKANSALPAAKAIERQLFADCADTAAAAIALSPLQVQQRGEQIACERNYPAALARRIPA